MEYSGYGTSQVMQAYTPDLGDVSVSQASQGYSTAKEEPMYASQTEADVTGASTSASMATLADYNQVRKLLLFIFQFKLGQIKS